MPFYPLSSSFIPNPVLVLPQQVSSALLLLCVHDLLLSFVFFVRGIAYGSDDYGMATTAAVPSEKVTQCDISIRIMVIFVILRAHLFVSAPLSGTSGGVGTIRPSGSRCRRFGRDPCNVSRVASLLNFFGLGHT